MSTTLLLDTATWDLCLDANGNIAVATDPYALAQDAACAIRLFRGELWYDTTQGVPYFQSILGQTPSAQFMKAKFEAAAMSVPGVLKATCYLTGLGPSRQLTGQVHVTNSAGVSAMASF